jgi:hypothetical protein
MKIPNFITYFMYILHKKRHLWHLENGNYHFYSKKNIIPEATMFTTVTPIVETKVNLLSWSMAWRWPGPGAYALKSMPLHNR